MFGAPKLGWLWGPILRRATLLRNSSQGAPHFPFAQGLTDHVASPAPSSGPHGRGELGSTVMPPKLCQPHAADLGPGHYLSLMEGPRLWRAASWPGLGTFPTASCSWTVTAVGSEWSLLCRPRPTRDARFVWVVHAQAEPKRENSYKFSTAEWQGPRLGVGSLLGCEPRAVKDGLPPQTTAKGMARCTWLARVWLLSDHPCCPQALRVQLAHNCLWQAFEVIRSLGKARLGSMSYQRWHLWLQGGSLGRSFVTDFGGGEVGVLQVVVVILVGLRFPSSFYRGRPDWP